MPGPALVSDPVLEMSAARVRVSVKLATIVPSLSMAGVTIEPLRPPVPRLSVLPAPMLTPPGALTVPPAVAVSVPIATEVWPTVTRPTTLKAEPDPLTVTDEVPGPWSPMPAPMGSETFT